MSMAEPTYGLKPIERFFLNGKSKDLAVHDGYKPLGKETSTRQGRIVFSDAAPDVFPLTRARQVLELSGCPICPPSSGILLKFRGFRPLRLEARKAALILFKNSLHSSQ